MTTKFDIIKLKSLAAMGDVEAMYTLATNYLYGIGVEADLERAHSYLEKAVDKGFEPAKGMIEAVFADEGNSTELVPEFKEDIYEAFKAMCQDADKGIPAALHMKSCLDCQMTLTILDSKELSKSKSWLVNRIMYLHYIPWVLFIIGEIVLRERNKKDCR